MAMKSSESKDKRPENYWFNISFARRKKLGMFAVSMIRRLSSIHKSVTRINLCKWNTISHTVIRKGHFDFQYCLFPVWLMNRLSDRVCLCVAICLDKELILMEIICLEYKMHLWLEMLMMTTLKDKSSNAWWNFSPLTKIYSYTW